MMIRGSGAGGSETPGPHRSNLARKSRTSGTAAFQFARNAPARDQEQLLGALGDLAVAAEANLEIPGARLLVRGRRGHARALDDHESPQAHVALVREPLAVPPDAVGRLRLAQGGEPERLESLVALRARP